MKYLFPIIIVLIGIYIFSCANPGSIQGGPKDTIPPTLISSIPENKSLNYKERVFTFEFDERVIADQLVSKLIITPRTENKFKHFIKKNRMTLTFEDHFEDSTTYTLNFADGVGDITEKNPVENFSFAFSTGPVIDSISVKGNVKDLYTNENQDAILIALFDIDDTLNLYTGKPKYFSKTDQSGNFIIENIKNGYYKLYAFLDDNNNLINEPGTEPHGFLSDTLDLNTSQDSLKLKVQLLDASEPKFIRAKNTGPYFDLLYNKYCQSYNISKIDSSNILSIPPNSLFKENTIIRFYKDPSFNYEKDSLQLAVTFFDSLHNKLIDTVFVKFNESSRKSENLKASISPNEKNIDPNLKLKFSFTKPISIFNRDSLLIKYDTIKTVVLPDSVFTWNINKTELTLQTLLDNSLIPKAIELLKVEQAKKDSINAINGLDSLSTKEEPQDQPKSNDEQALGNRLKRRPGQSSGKSSGSIKNKIDIYISGSTFISVEEDTLESRTLSYNFKENEDYGVLRGSIKTDKKNYFLQLTTPKYDVIQQIKNPKNFEFTSVPPGKYTFRILIDENADGQWTYGNILKDIEPEPIWFYSETIDLRANWEVENLDISF